MAGGKKVPFRLIPMHANVLEDFFIVFILTGCTITKTFNCIQVSNHFFSSGNYYRYKAVNWDSVLLQAVRNYSKIATI